MSHASTKKIFINVESDTEQQEHLSNQRKTLKTLQSGATDKENLAGRPLVDRLSRLKAAATDTNVGEFTKRKKTETRAAATQTSPKKGITAEDLVSTQEPSAKYWEKLAEKRRSVLEETLKENQRLHERISGLEEELDTSRQMLDEARNLVEVLTDMLKEDEEQQQEASDTDETKPHADDDNATVDASTTTETGISGIANLQNEEVSQDADVAE